MRRHRALQVAKVRCLQQTCACNQSSALRRPSRSLGPHTRHACFGRRGCNQTCGRRRRRPIWRAPRAAARSSGSRTCAPSPPALTFRVPTAPVRACQARIKKMMQVDEDVGRIATDALDLVGARSPPSAAAAAHSRAAPPSPQARASSSSPTNSSARPRPSRRRPGRALSSASTCALPSHPGGPSSHARACLRAHHSLPARRGHLTLAHAVRAPTRRSKDCVGAEPLFDFLKGVEARAPAPKRPRAAGGATSAGKRKAGGAPGGGAAAAGSGSSELPAATLAAAADYRPLQDCDDDYDAE